MPQRSVLFEKLNKLTPRIAQLLCAVSLVFLTACAGSRPPAEGINDPYEAQNRAVHEENLNIDKILVKPASRGYGSIIPQPVRKGISNFSSNINLPGVVVNDLLQLNIPDALKNSTRFLFNTTIGLAGILDPSTAMGLPEESTDFGETLYVWGVGEGPYVELPLLGPTTQRDMVGKVVDLFTNPIMYQLPDTERYLATVAAVGSKLDDRYTYSNTVDSILYDSADSYAQARLLFLQHRRFQLSGGVVDESTDIFDELYGDQ